MRVLYWADGFWPRLGGTEAQGLQFVKGMQARGHQCVVLAQKDHPNWKEDEIYQNITIKRLDFDAIIASRELKNIHAIKEYLLWVVKEFQPDIVYLNTFNGGSAFAFLLYRKMFNVPVIVTVHAPYYRDTVPSYVKEICSQVNQICCVSNWALSVMEKFLPEFKHKLRMIYNGLSMPKIVPSPLPFSPPTILLLGRLSWEKGFASAIEAFLILKRKGSDAQLIVAGEGSEKSCLQHLVKECGLDNSVRFTGELSRDEVPSIINQATFVVMNSFFEAFGLVALESMQMQRPVIAPAVGGLMEVILERETGLLVPPQDSAALCNAMEYLILHPEQTIEMGVRGRKHAKESFSLNEHVILYEELFQECCVCH